MDGTVNAGRKGIAYLRDHYRPPLAEATPPPTEGREAEEGREAVVGARQG